LRFPEPADTPESRRGPIAARGGRNLFRWRRKRCRRGVAPPVFVGRIHRWNEVRQDFATSVALAGQAM